MKFKLDINEPTPMTLEDIIGKTDTIISMSPMTYNTEKDAYVATISATITTRHQRTRPRPGDRGRVHGSNQQRDKEADV